VRFISSILFIASLVATPTVVLATQANVPAASWYASTVTAFVDAGYFNDVQSFRPTEPATRGEFVELVVKMMGGLTHAPYSGQSFDDVSLNSPLYGYFEEAALARWVKGTNGCYGTHPCLAKPDSPINRAEAASLLNRAFGLQAKDKAPTFQDNSPGQWFTNDIRIAASLCILKGDAGGKRVRPADNINRAEMVVMLERLKKGISYPTCSSDKEFSLPKAPANQTTGYQQSIDSSVPASSSAGDNLITPNGERAITYSRCTASAWSCTAGSCVSGTALAPVCTLIDSNCLNPELAKPVVSMPMCISPSSSSSSSGGLPSSVPSTDQVSIKLSIQSFLLNSDANLSSMQQTADHYNDSSHQGMYSQMTTWLATYQIAYAQLKYLGKVTEIRDLTPDEITKVGELKIQMNEMIDKFNNAFR
jgi:hypothetical protein